MTWVNPESQDLLASGWLCRRLINAVSSVLVGKTAGQLGVWLRDELTQRGYDLARGGQSRFARETGIHVSVLNRVLNGDRGVEIDALRRMGGALGYSLGEMLIHAGLAERGELPVRPPEDMPAAPQYADLQEQQIWEIEGLAALERRMLINFLRALRAEEAAEDERPSASVQQLRRPS